MESINFNIGNIKEYAINGDENNTIKIDVSDYGLIERFKTAMTEIESVQQEYKSINNPNEDVFKEMDKKARDIVNKAFDNDVCSKAFGNKNCLSTASNGKPMLINFLEAFIPIIQRDFGSVIKAQQITIEQKTEKYTKPVIVQSKPQFVGMTTPAIDVSNMTADEKAALIKDLLK